MDAPVRLVALGRLTRYERLARELASLRDVIEQSSELTIKFELSHHNIRRVVSVGDKVE